MRSSSEEENENAPILNFYDALCHALVPSTCAARLHETR